MKATLKLPWPPSVNHLHVPYRGRKIKSSAGRNFAKAVADAMFLQQAEYTRAVGMEYANGLSVTMQFFGPANNTKGHNIGARKYDIANYEKACIDALTEAGVLKDDKYIDRLTLIRGEQRGKPCVIVEIDNG